MIPAENQSGSCRQIDPATVCATAAEGQSALVKVYEAAIVELNGGERCGMRARFHECARVIESVHSTVPAEISFAPRLKDRPSQIVERAVDKNQIACAGPIVRAAALEPAVQRFGLSP